MLNKAMIGRYYHLSSKIHSMNSLSKVIITILFIVIVFIVQDPILLLFVTVLAVLMMMLSHIPLFVYGKAIWSLKYFLLGLFLLSLLFQVPLLETGLSILRIVLVILYTSILTMTTTPSELTYGLSQFFSPLSFFRVPVSSLALVLSLSIRYIPTLFDQGEHILKAQASRGIDYYHSSLIGKLKCVASLIFPMFVLSLKKSEQLADVMEVRLYDTSLKRTNYRMNPWRFFDTYLVFMHGMIFVLMVMETFL